MTVTSTAAETAAMNWRVLGMEDVEAIYRLHIAATDAVGRPDFIRPETLEFFVKMLSGAGIIVGVHDLHGLLAYGVLQWDLSIEEDPRPALQLTEADSLAKLAGASVRPGTWGSGLHRRMIDWRREEARARGFRHLYATSAPGNERSWTNLIEEGLQIRSIRQQYGGHLRYVMATDLEDTRPWSCQVSWCDVKDIAGQNTMLAQGLVGFAWENREGRRMICYGQRQP
ncbi:hypothetical protein FHS85_000518 [Rhodoligotrophos appendicifer]|uniref:hypothetical protein n=1 Tax=Rhodoligotrophos appendicifer TaxID=987056 RepID=UPI001478F327|nr:hypothetical protein [Rhodoligotrophos appendicifer]